MLNKRIVYRSWLGWFTLQTFNIHAYSNNTFPRRLETVSSTNLIYLSPYSRLNHSTKFLSLQSLRVPVRKKLGKKSKGGVGERRSVRCSNTRRAPSPYLPATRAASTSSKEILPTNGSSDPLSLSFASPPLDKGDIASNVKERGDYGFAIGNWKLRKFLLDTCRLRWII